LECPVITLTCVQTNAYVVQFNNSSTPGSTSFWDFGGGVTSTEDNPSHDFASSNTWPVQLIVSNGCGSDTLDTTVVVVETGIAEIEASNLSISDQGGILNLQSNSPFETGTILTISNLSGQLVGGRIHASNNQHCLRVPTQQLAPGIYFITLQSPSGQLTVKWFKTTNY
jgi:PKD repeat protein